ncbi:hypothetical protein A1O1_08938 [Capronia coronata CBS 617.96]|uniref:Uncharacterized protein n=1 Tax=Capronia coronata CBS 617.96 TaxID=1182541 RepID=W9XDJ0_9EURO|nr:uncharacterized protein A1O1_08938 [Capronia coronata CBS 617.96]EXJ78537.1 hypothetical protein A1O1_08938 [Capronia coronata CBS 617.96]
MTRRKRTPSPSPSSPQKRVAFEIPASLQQFSTISRSLATNKDLNTPAPSSSGQHVTHAESRPRPSPQALLQPAATFSTGPKSGGNVAPQKQPSTNGQTWQEPLQRNNRPLASSRQGDEPGRHPSVAGGFPQFAPAQTSALVAPTSMSLQVQKEGLPAATPSIGEEPALKPGETPSLTTHPNLIASLIAQKRAENEQKGMRQIWARRQAEYLSSKSPSSQLATELSTEAGRNEAPNPDSGAISNTLPTRPMQPRAAYAPALSRLEVQTPATDSVSTPATEASAKDTETPKPLLASENDSLFGSPFSSPMAEFLEKATDNAGLKEGVDQGSTANTRISAAPTSVGQNPDAARPAASQPSEARNPSRAVTIPPLFSDHPQRSQVPPQNQMYHGGIGANTSMPQKQLAAMQRQHQPNPSVPATQPGPRRGSFMPTSSVASHTTPTPQRHPYFQQTPSPGGYYKVDFRNSSGATPNSGPNATTFSPLMYAKSPGQADPGYPSYSIGMLPMYPVAQPLQGQIPAYGVDPAHATATPAVVVSGPHQLKRHSFNPNSLTPADMVAGINTRFKISTKDDFVVPKR